MVKKAKVQDRPLKWYVGDILIYQREGKTRKDFAMGLIVAIHDRECGKLTEFLEVSDGINKVMVRPLNIIEIIPATLGTAYLLEQQPTISDPTSDDLLKVIQDRGENSYVCETSDWSMDGIAEAVNSIQAKQDGRTTFTAGTFEAVGTEYQVLIGHTRTLTDSELDSIILRLKQDYETTDTFEEDWS